MTLFIQTDAGSDGTGTVFQNQAEADLFIISNMDPKLGENPLSSPADLIEVTYPVREQPGFPPERLFELVNTKFKEVPADPTDIIILAVDNSFTLTTGELITARGGTSLPPKSSGEPGSAENPTESVIVIYDKESDGFCQLGLKSQKFDLASPTSVTLFHELSHAFRQATKTSLSLAATGCETSPEEKAAEEDENKMREQLKVPLRDPTNHCAEPCNAKSNCCIVASIATGSHSVELNALRQLREGFLRRSEVGYDFFERLHYDYYAFSPQVCRAMARDAMLVENIATYYVKPLKECLELARAHLIEDLTRRELGERMVRTIPSELRSVSRARVAAALSALREGEPNAQEPTQPAAMGAQAITRSDSLSLLATPPTASQSPYVRWALIETIETYLLALSEHREGLTTLEVGHRLAERLDDWSTRLPVTDVWAELSDYEVEAELDFLGGCLLRSPAAKGEFSQRLRAHFPTDERLPKLLSAAGYPDAREARRLVEMV